MCMYLEQYKHLKYSKHQNFGEGGLEGSLSV